MPVTLQLKLRQQFRFAGCCAARERGHCRSAGLCVRFNEDRPDQDVAVTVARGGRTGCDRKPGLGTTSCIELPAASPI